MLRSIFLAAALLLGTGTIVYAETTLSYWISKNALTKQMEEQGYSEIEITAADGRWVGQAIKDGKIIEFHADPHTGMITKDLKDAKD
jgi:hypothetical protein